MMKRYREYTQVHTMKCWNTLSEIYSSQNGKRWNGYTYLHQPSFLCPPPTMGFKPTSWIHQLLHLTARIWAVPCWLSNRPTSHYNALWFHTPRWFWLVHFFFNILPTPPTPGGFVPFFSLLILTIAWCSYTGDIL